MCEQHACHQPKLRALLDASAALRQRPGDTARRNALAQAADVLGSEFAEHLALEEGVIFPAIRRFVSPAVQMEMVEELRRRRRHDGSNASG